MAWQKWRYGFHLLKAAVWLTLAYARAFWYFKTRAMADLALPSSKALTTKEKRRWRHYFFGTTFLSTVFTMLRGSPRSTAEKRLFANLAALACFFDDLIDTAGGVQKANTKSPEQYGRTADPSGLALHFLENTYRLLPPEHLPEFKIFLHRVFNIETQGRQQNNQAVSLPDLERITAEKGGYSVLLFRRALAHSLPETEEQALFEFGALVQLCDDIFDLWFDRQSGTATLATVLVETNHLTELNQRFERQVDTTRRLFRNTPYPARRVETALCALHFLVSITRVCLRHYVDLQKKHGTLPLDSRADMVVDMERWRNRWRAGRELWLPSDG